MRTGDVCKIDPDGDLFVVDRLKELIKTQGYQVPPAELEDLLLHHSDVQDVAVIPVFDDEKHTEFPRAYVVLAMGVEPTKEKADLIAKFVADRKSHYKWLVGGVKFVKQIPKSPSGKILRRVIRGWVKEEQDKAKATAKLKQICS